MMNRLAQRNQATQQSYQNVMANTLQQQGLDQQRLANLQSFAFGQPLVNQLGGLSGLQQQAVPYIPTQMQNMGQPITQAQQGSQNFALDRYGTQAGIYGNQLQAAGQGAAGFGQLLGSGMSAYGMMNASPTSVTNIFGQH